MKGLIYKEITIFLKGTDKRLFLIAGGAIVLLMVKTGVYAGLLASIMFAVSIGIQNVTGFTSDEKVDWKKYISVLCTLIVSLTGSMLFNLISSIAHQSFSGVFWGISAAVSVIIPLFWTGLSLPLAYWFGYRSAQVMGVIAVFPMFYIIKYFEDGAGGFSAMADSMLSCVAFAGIAAIVLFILSMGISVIVYNRKR